MWSYTDYTIYTGGCHFNPKYYHLLENTFTLYKTLTWLSLLLTQEAETEQ